MKTKFQTIPRTIRLQSLVLAASLTVPTAALMAQARDDGREPNSRNAATINSDEDREIEIFEGKLMTLHAYLAKQDHGDDKAEQRTFSRTTEFNRTAGNQPASANSGADRDRTPGQRASMGLQMNEPEGPMGIVVKNEGVLGVGSGEEFYILTFDPSNNTSKEAYQRTARFSRTGNLLEQSDRDYVRDPASRGQTQRSSSLENRQNADRSGLDRSRNQENQARPGSQNAADAPAVPTSGNLVRITGEKVERGEIEAIIVHSVSPGTREGEVSDEDLQDRDDRSDD